MKQVKNSLFFVIFSFLLITNLVVSAYGHGLGSVESELLYINQNYLKIKVETNPDVLSGNESEIKFDITTINDDTGEIVSNIEYKIEIFDVNNNDLILSFDAYSPGEKLTTKIIPSDSINFQGKQTESGIWIGSNESPLVIEAPLFQQGGLVQVNVTMISHESVPVKGNETTFETLLTIGEYIPFEITNKGNSYDLMFATYFDKIQEFHFDEDDKKLTALMPFNWNKEFIEQIPFVHAEYYIPKTLDIFSEHDILMSVNEISILGTIDRSGEDEIVVHFLIPTSKLLKLYDEIAESDKDKIVFGIESGKKREVIKEDASLEDGDKVIILSTQEDWKFHLSLTPKGKIIPNSELALNLEFHDPVTNSLIPLITYDLDIFLNGELIKSEKELETPDGKDVVHMVFPESGAVIVRISNVNNFDTSGEFSFRVSQDIQTKAQFDHLIEISSGSLIPGCEKTNSCYMPNYLNIRQNETVMWKNNDSGAHTVTYGTPNSDTLRIFDSEIMPAGSNFYYSFPNMGNFDYYCTLHPWMTGSIKVGQDTPDVPDWIKNNAKWWSEGQISDTDFSTGLEFLVKEDVIVIPDDVISLNNSETIIPDWLRNNAKWWSEDLLTDSEFLKGIEWMIKNGIITI